MARQCRTAAFAPDKPFMAAADPRLPDARDRFLALLAESLAQGTFARLQLSGWHGADTSLKQLRVRRLLLRGEDSLSFVWRHATRDVTKNHPLEEGLALIGAALQAGEFDHAHLQTAAEDVQLATSRKGRVTLRRGRLPEAAVPAPDEAHDREKHRYLQLDRPFLVDLGITDAQNRLVPAMARKWKQINKFVEVLDHALAASPLAGRRELRVLDFGCGKGYLTFAVEEHLRGNLGIDARVTGVELRGELVDLCNAAAQRNGLTGLHFEQGDIASHPPEPMDVMIALHACDTATDLALHVGIRAGASVILCSPCCHKQLRPQMMCPRPLGPMLQFGIHMGQQAEMVTDSLRALLLQAEGYETQVFEFIALEHTSKNKMILAIRREGAAKRDEALAQVDEIKRFYGVREQALETLLNAH